MFEHEDAATCWVAIEIENTPQRVLVIETELPLAPKDAEYDEAKVNALVAAAQAFKSDKANGIDKVRLVCIEYDIDDEDEDEDEEAA
jgi:hypothetical protein